MERPAIYAQGYVDRSSRFRKRLPGLDYLERQKLEPWKQRMSVEASIIVGLTSKTANGAAHRIRGLQKIGNVQYKLSKPIAIVNKLH
jgi:hypothetical protein